MSVKASDACKNARRMIKDGYVYVYGYKGTKVTKAGVSNLARMYPSVFTSSIKSMAMNKVGKIGIDCSGFVSKATGTNHGGSTGIKDSFKVCHKVSNDSHVVDGMGIWHQGHIALIHVNDEGKAYIYEARSTAKDCTISTWEERAKDFTYYGKIDGVDYNGANVKGKGKTRSSKTKVVCKIYKTQDVKKGVIAKLDKGIYVNILKDMKDGWSKVYYKGKTGYMKNTALNTIGLSKYPTKKLKNNTYIRKTNKKVSKKIGKLKAGDTVNIICKRKYWTNIGTGKWVATKNIKW